jgi:hypothetical protein
LTAYEIDLFEGEYLEWLKDKQLPDAFQTLERAVQSVPLAGLPTFLEHLEKVKAMGWVRLHRRIGLGGK